MKIEQYVDKQTGRKMWRFDVTINNVRYRHGRFENKSDVELAIAGLRLLAQSSKYGLPSPVQPIKVDELIAMAEKKCPKQKDILLIFKSSVDVNKTVQQLKRADMAKFLEVLEARKLKPGTINNYKQRLYGVLNRAGEWFAELDEWYPPKFPKIEKATARQRILTKDELSALFRVWRNPQRLFRESAKWRDYRLELYDMARLMLLTGARREELEKITPAVIDKREYWLNLQSGKTRSWHAIPLNEDAMELLLNRENFKPMFNCYRGSTIHYVIQRVGKAAGVPTGQEVHHGWTFHDLRRTAASYIESNGIAYSAVSATLGHRRQDVTAVYTPAQISELRRAALLLQNHWREIDGAICKHLDHSEKRQA